jgi:hypothetical protein
MPLFESHRRRLLRHSSRCRRSLPTQPKQRVLWRDISEIERNVEPLEATSVADTSLRQPFLENAACEALRGLAFDTSPVRGREAGDAAGRRCLHQEVISRNRSALCLSRWAVFFSVFPEIAPLRICEDSRTKHVGHGRILQTAIIEHGKAFADGCVPGLVGGDVDRRADADQLEGLPGGVNRHPHAAVRARSRLHKTPVQTVGRLKLHPVRHRVASSRAALTAAIGHLRVDPKVAVGCRRGSRANGNRRGEKDGIPLDDVEPLGSAAELELHRGGILRLLNWWIKGK